jgi:hypothetical protein
VRKRRQELQEAAHQKADAVERDFGQRHDGSPAWIQDIAGFNPVG